MGMIRSCVGACWTFERGDCRLTTVNVPLAGSQFLFKGKPRERAIQGIHDGVKADGPSLPPKQERASSGVRDDCLSGFACNAVQQTNVVSTRMSTASK